MRYAENISAKLLIFAIKSRQQFICTKKKKNTRAAVCMYPPFKSNGRNLEEM